MSHKIENLTLTKVVVSTSLTRGKKTIMMVEGQVGNEVKSFIVANYSQYCEAPLAEFFTSFADKKAEDVLPVEMPSGFSLSVKDENSKYGVLNYDVFEQETNLQSLAEDFVAELEHRAIKRESRRTLPFGKKGGRFGY